MNVEKLKQLLYKSWSYETCSLGFKKYWSSENPSYGQCAITALIVNDFYGGKIMRCMTSIGSHYYNFINNEIIDLTKDQFLNENPDYINGEERSREYLLGNEDTKNRYLQLLNNLKKEIVLNEGKSYLLIDSKKSRKGE